MREDSSPPLMAFVIDTPILASITNDMVRLGPRVRITGVSSAENGLGGASTSISPLSSDLRIRGVLTKYCLLLSSAIGIFASKNGITDKELSVFKSRTAIKPPM